MEDEAWTSVLGNNNMAACNSVSYGQVHALPPAHVQRAGSMPSHHAGTNPSQRPLRLGMGKGGDIWQLSLAMLGTNPSQYTMPDFGPASTTRNNIMIRSGSKTDAIPPGINSSHNNNQSTTIVT